MNKVCIPLLAAIVMIGAHDSLAQRPADPGRGRRGGSRNRMMRMLPVMVALDADQDGSINPSEIENATRALKALDRDGDGKLAGDELQPDMSMMPGGPGGPGGRGGRGGFGGGRNIGRPDRFDERAESEPQGRRGGVGRRSPGRGGFGGMMRMMPVMQVLDENEDGELSSEELDNASTNLKTLDHNKDNELTREELRPAFGGRGRGPGRFGGGDSDTNRLSPEEVEFKDGVGTIPDRATFKKLAYQGQEVLIDTHLAGQEFVKFQIAHAATDEAQLYFMNTKTHRAHMMFMSVVGLPRGEDGEMRGVLVYRPLSLAPNGQPGLYTYEFEPNDSFSFEMVKNAGDLLVANMPILKGALGYYPMPGAMARYQREKAKFEASNIRVYLDEKLFAEIGYLPLNEAETFGRLRVLQSNQRPSPREVVLCKTLPNELPRVAGIITAVRQTPLSHVNLRAVQDHVPNAFIKAAANDPRIAPLIGKYVYYKVAKDVFEIREASLSEVEAHFAHLRPRELQIPKRDLTATGIRSLDHITFADSTSVGVKTANLAALRRFGLPEGTVPAGFGVPFYFYDSYMKGNGFYEHARKMTAKSSFKNDAGKRQKELERFQNIIRQGKMPADLSVALGDLQKSFPSGTPLRCRSSTNTEDLQGFSGAGLYDSCTHQPDEGHLSHSIKQVFASLWNYRAYEEREFYGIDHFGAAMGVLVHPNFKEELANGVAVTDDILYQTQGNYYINTQVGENLVTNPEAHSTPEEILLDWWDSKRLKIMSRSSLVRNGAPILTAKYLSGMRVLLGKVHLGFSRLYGVSLNEQEWAIEVEFKITSDGALVIKQARPWVF